jgi:nucleotide-binding universal stress UspA family protein
MDAMFEDVLVVLDGRAVSERILGWVRRLCRTSCARVHLLIVRSPEQTVWVAGRPVAFGSQLEDASRLESLAYLRGVTARLERAGIRVTPEVRFGSPIDAVLGAARDSGAKLVALAASGRADGGDALGRLARELLRRMPIPVLVARVRDQRAA